MAWVTWPSVQVLMSPARAVIKAPSCRSGLHGLRYGKPSVRGGLALAAPPDAPPDTSPELVVTPWRSSNSINIKCSSSPKHLQAIIAYIQPSASLDLPQYVMNRSVAPPMAEQLHCDILAFCSALQAGSICRRPRPDLPLPRESHVHVHSLNFGSQCHQIFNVLISRPRFLPSHPQTKAEGKAVSWTTRRICTRPWS